jgi:hypothetical protein
MRLSKSLARPSENRVIKSTNYAIEKRILTDAWKDLGRSLWKPWYFSNLLEHPQG